MSKLKVGDRVKYTANGRKGRITSEDRCRVTDEPKFVVKHNNLSTAEYWAHALLLDEDYYKTSSFKLGDRVVCPTTKRKGTICSIELDEWSRKNIIGVQATDGTFLGYWEEDLKLDIPLNKCEDANKDTESFKTPLIETKRRVVKGDHHTTGSFAKISVLDVERDEVYIRIHDGMMKVDDLREAATLFNQMADILEDSSND